MKLISGITYLKAFLPFLVIACHARPFGELPFSKMPLPESPSFIDVVFNNVLTLSVPLFFIISLYLYLKKRSRSDNPNAALKSRIIYLLSLFVVFRVIYFFFGYGDFWLPERGLIVNVYHLVFGGGDTIVYYLENLIFLMLVLEVVLRFCDKVKIQKTKLCLVFSALCTLLILVLNFLPSGIMKAEALRHFSPVAFLPYVFIAYLFDSCENKPKLRYLIALLISGAVFAVFEWRFMSDVSLLQYSFSTAMPSYARVSVVLISSAVFGFSLYIEGKPSKAVEYLSALSLYSYCIHKIIVMYFYGEVSNPAVGYFLVTVITYALSALIYFVKNYLKKLKNNRISEETK